MLDKRLRLVFKRLVWESAADFQKTKSGSPLYPDLPCFVMSATQYSAHLVDSRRQKEVIPERI